MKIFKQEAGQDLIEYTFVLPILLLLVFGIMEFGILFFNYSTVASAAREGARAGILPATTACNVACRNAAAAAAVTNMSTGLNPGNLTIVVTRPTAATIQVAVTYNTSLITGPMIAAVGGSGAISLQSVATMKTE